MLWWPQYLFPAMEKLLEQAKLSKNNEEKDTKYISFDLYPWSIQWPRLKLGGQVLRSFLDKLGPLFCWYISLYPSLEFLPLPPPLALSFCFFFILSFCSLPRAFLQVVLSFPPLVSYLLFLWFLSSFSIKTSSLVPDLELLFWDSFSCSSSFFSLVSMAMVGDGWTPWRSKLVGGSLAFRKALFLFLFLLFETPAR